ncbi:MAG: AraC family transcriptional regulator [Oscillospiraceae bacterium]|nr:AraC family transcriptional regulator [Oscillospiraceae bacterium]
MKQLQNFDFLNLNAIYRQGGHYAPRLGTDWRYEGNHTFCQNKFYFVVGGTFEISIDGVDYTARPGDWFFIPADVPHKYHNFPDKPMEKYWMHFDLYPSSDLLSPLNVQHRVDASNTPRVTELFREFADLCQNWDIYSRLRVKAIILELIAEYIRLAGKHTQIVNDDRGEEIRNVLSYINENFRRNLTIEELAEVCHLHPTHFIRAFKLKTAQTPHQYINDIRMEYARQLLDRSDRSIVEIAEDAGFYDPAHFSRAFKRHFAMTPTQYRNNTLPQDR